MYFRYSTTYLWTIGGSVAPGDDTRMRAIPVCRPLGSDMIGRYGLPIPRPEVAQYVQCARRNLWRLSVISSAQALQASTAGWDDHASHPARIARASRAPKPPQRICLSQTAPSSGHPGCARTFSFHPAERFMSSGVAKSRRRQASLQTADVALDGYWFRGCGRCAEAGVEGVRVSVMLWSLTVANHSPLGALV